MKSTRQLPAVDIKNGSEIQFVWKPRKKQVS